MANEFLDVVTEHLACLDTLIEFTNRIDRLPDGLQLTNGSTMAGRQLTAGDFKCLRSMAAQLIELHSIHR